MEDDDEATPPVPPIGYERLVAESKFLGDALEMPPPDSNGEEYRVVMARNSGAWNWLSGVRSTGHWRCAAIDDRPPTP
jgi:hypothetical protein